MSPDDVSRSALAAGREVLKRTAAHLDSGLSFTVETTLAGNGPITTMRAARERGFDVHLIYVSLDTAERNIRRVRERVAQGGHHVPDEDVVRRYQRSLENLPEAIRLAHAGSIFDNSGPAHRLILRTSEGRITWASDSLPEWIRSLIGG